MKKLTPEQALEKYWGYHEFRPLQHQAVETVLGGRDALVVMPTGGGKSLCYQLPAACGIGLVLVVSPLIALMDDQVAAVNEMGMQAGALHSQSPEKDRRRVFAQLHAGSLDLLYVSPERLVTGGLFDLIRPRLGLFAVDEAHCVSHWGHEFRPEYRQLGPLFAGFAGVPRIALTATATPNVQTDIVTQLGLRDPVALIGHPDRPNLTYRSFPRYDQGAQVLDVIRRHHGEGGIVYAQTRKEVDRLVKSLARAGVSCAPYHAGLNGTLRATAQDDFVHERLDVIVATIAFGMGIDRSNVRYVVHANTPKSIEHYQQESGRAGRDGEPAECVLLFSVGDLVTHKMLSFREENISPARRRVIERQLNEIGRYAIAPVCRHRLLAEHFGKPYPPEGYSAGDAAEPGCGACDVCLGETTAMPGEESQLIAQKIISAVYRTEGRFGAGYVTKVLLGSEDDRISANSHDGLKVFGLMKGTPEKAIRAWIDQLIVQGHLAVTDGEYPLLQVTQSGLNACKGTEPVRLGHPVVRLPARKSKKSATADALPGAATPLFENLRRLRLLLARQLGIPPYMVFADSVLTSLALLKPADLDAMRGIKGVGDNKRDRYGRVFLAVIAGTDPETAAGSFT
ncbi:MAG TPA: RecQ family ATP-dependent DNA helicase [Candidatus Rifleibacterium sp.]|nr:RecQ family ATP-dependent DNA helicase [Candidatus Rifleibacterium sp.]HPT46556.1 RecQ family ATP-dependent DNA helicase [Candidatus Rifleibacterium sp.]